ncbi:MAG: enoyl-CoA hydratase/isomerase family protein [Pseudomonadota bacterium]
MSEDIQTRIVGDVGHITLNRPDALHALNQEMCAKMLSELEDWSANPRVRAVVVDHIEGSRGFCAGGDIRMLARSGKADGEEAMGFFATEYRLNTAIFNFRKPFIAFMDGITMGGGVGISVHGTHRIATERTLFAMPETGIGLFPDVGGGWFLPRLRGELGTWLALTGARLKGTDVLAAGIATHFVSSARIGEMKTKLLDASLSSNAHQEVGQIISEFDEPETVGSFKLHIAKMDKCFAFNRAEDIIATLEDDASAWAIEQAEILKTKSPRTIKVALRQVREGAQFRSFEENMRNEYRIAWRQVRSDDFLEGVRAIIVDKDNEPQWKPGELNDVADEVIDSIFAPLPDNRELTF